MGLLGNSSGGSPGLPANIPNPIFTGQVSVAAGTAAAPSIAWTDDALATGFYRPTGNQIGWTVGGTAAGRLYASNVWIASDSAVFSGGLSQDAAMQRVAANGWRFGATGGITTTSRTEINKAVTAFTDAAAKTVFTVTVPNAAHHAVIEVEVQGALGAGGAIGAGEAMATNTYKIAIVRTAGVATVATATAATHAVAVAVAGAATVTATAAVSAISGAVGATQTFTIDVTITKSGGSSDNHTCLAYAKLVNANSTGITIA